MLRIIASSAPEHARRLGADGVVTAAVQSAAGSSHKTAEGASLWAETLRLWSAVARGGGATPSIDGLFPLLAPMMEPSTANTAPRSPLEAATSAALAAECFALFAGLTASLRDAAGAKFDKVHGWIPPEVDDNGVFKDAERKDPSDEVHHPSTSLTMTSESGDRLSWACAAGAAAAAEATVIGKPQAGIFQQALSSMGLEAHETIMVGDTIDTDIRGARAAKLRSVLVESGNANVSSISADIQVKDLGELHRAFAAFDSQKGDAA